MNTTYLTHKLSDGTEYSVKFLPEHGMNMASFKRGAIEVIDQKTKDLFEQHSGGLGAIIGPHFHRRKRAAVPAFPNQDAFPEIAYSKERGIEDPFSHGIARYSPWKVISQSENHIISEISGKDCFREVPLSAIEGQNFVMRMNASIGSEGLQLKLSIVSDTDSLVGIHYYYRLPEGVNRIKSHVQENCYREGRLERIPSDWGFDGKKIDFILDKAADFTFFPAPDPLHADIWLETEEYRLKTAYTSHCQENSWQLYHPKNASFVCIEPVSAQDPRHPNLTVSSISINLQILPNTPLHAEF